MRRRGKESSSTSVFVVANESVVKRRKWEKGGWKTKGVKRGREEGLRGDSRKKRVTGTMGGLLRHGLLAVIAICEQWRANDSVEKEKEKEKRIKDPDRERVGDRGSLILFAVKESF